MVENLKRFREPVAWAVIGLVVASMALSIIKLVVAMTMTKRPVFAAFQDIANNSMSLSLVVTLIALVCVCLFVIPATPHARTVARWAAIVVTLGTILSIVATGLGVWATPGLVAVVLELLGGVVDIVVKVVATVVLWIIDRAVRVGHMGQQAELVEPDVDPTTRAVQDETPVWQPGLASGSVWRTAAEAASGGPAASSAVEKNSEPQNAWTAAQGRAGAAEALGWRRVGSEGDRKDTSAGQ